jgi:YggT family protein
MTFVLTFISLLANILAFAIFIRSILSWFPNSLNNQFGVILAQITDPVLVPLRRVIPPLGMIDITPMVAIILLYLIANLTQAAI